MTKKASAEAMVCNISHRAVLGGVGRQELNVHFLEPAKVSVEQQGSLPNISELSDAGKYCHKLLPMQEWLRLLQRMGISI